MRIFVLTVVTALHSVRPTPWIYPTALPERWFTPNRNASNVWLAFVFALITHARQRFNRKIPVSILKNVHESETDLSKFYPS